jgi:hypothetical protein
MKNLIILVACTIMGIVMNIDGFTQGINRQYCFTKENVNCKRYIGRKAGEKVSENLLSDGSRFSNSLLVKQQKKRAYKFLQFIGPLFI